MPVIAWFLLLLVACAPAEARRPPADTPGLVLGEFELAPRAIVDGDTLRVIGLEETLRLLGLDAEETFKKKREREELAARGLADYLRVGRAGARRPVKLATPMGEEAKAFAAGFFADVKRVRLERDHAQEIRDTYGRFLVYALVDKAGKTLNYNVEAVRAGMSPYFAKYGYSRRFHAEFVKAQAEAQQAGRGIWSAKGEHYDDYPERLAWWNARGDQLRRGEKLGAIVLTRADALEQLAAREGQEVVVLGSIANVVPGKGKRPARIRLARPDSEHFELIVFARDLLPAILTRVDDGYLLARGKLGRYRGELQLIIERDEQVSVP